MLTVSTGFHMSSISGSFVTTFKLEARFITVNQQMHTVFVYIQLYCIKTLKTVTGFDPCGKLGSV
jgi:hypothetical protein